MYKDDKLNEAEQISKDLISLVNELLNRIEELMKERDELEEVLKTNKLLLKNTLKDKLDYYIKNQSSMFSCSNDTCKHNFKVRKIELIKEIIISLNLKDIFYDEDGYTKKEYL